MLKNILKTIKEITSDMLSKKFYYFLLLILFSEFIIIVTNKLFPLYNIFLNLYPQGITQESIWILEIIFYISFTLSVIYSLTFWLFLLFDSLIDKYIKRIKQQPSRYEQFNSLQKKIFKISYGCSLNLSVTNTILLIVSIPLIYLNESLFIGSWVAHPILCILTIIMMFLTIFSTLDDVINHFFSI